MAKSLEFDETPSLRYLGLAQEYSPSPKNDPIAFLLKHLSQLPPHLLAHYSLITTPKQRTGIPTVRNRRLKWISTSPPELKFVSARNTWPGLWEGGLRGAGAHEAKDERRWVESEFLKGTVKQVGKLAHLLGDYEEERENERVRALRMVQEADEFVPEEDEDTDEEDDSPLPSPEPETDLERQANFERRVRERFIYGLLEGIDYDKVDWDESLDDDREAEDRYFDADDDEDDDELFRAHLQSL